MSFEERLGRPGSRVMSGSCMEADPSGLYLSWLLSTNTHGHPRRAPLGDRPDISEIAACMRDCFAGTSSVTVELLCIATLHARHDALAAFRTWSIQSLVVHLLGTRTLRPLLETVSRCGGEQRKVQGEGRAVAHM